jgi:hypothetical protein
MIIIEDDAEQLLTEPAEPVKSEAEVFACRMTTTDDQQEVVDNCRRNEGIGRDIDGWGVEYDAIVVGPQSIDQQAQPATLEMSRLARAATGDDVESGIRGGDRPDACIAIQPFAKAQVAMLSDLMIERWSAQIAIDQQNT